MNAMRVRDLMTDRVLAVGPDDDLCTLHDLMVENGIRHVPVVDSEGNLAGLVTHRDLLRSSLIEQPNVTSYLEEAMLERVKAAEIMTTGVETVDPETDLRLAAQLMLENKYGCLPVTEGSHLVGILTEADFVRLMAEGH
ncbi:MAG: CBS domain-containing protein [Acidobacteria bacterium]|nr:CBS domain-containing protein [Acidobacteriota bacterium]